jgi:hypothetical protein
MVQYIEAIILSALTTRISSPSVSPTSSAPLPGCTEAMNIPVALKMIFYLNKYD